jgi:hypothetical protein
MTNVTSKQVEAGQAVYTNRTLAVYDLVVLGISNRFIWKCPTRRLEEHYNQHISNRNDPLDGLKEALNQRFRDVSVDVIGCAALFCGRV